ncbi:MAG: SDR family oxidoreductase [Halobacteriales archaeon]
MDLDIEGNAALITASSSGLGKAAATALAREGVDVVINGRDTDRLAEAIADIETAAADGASVVGQAGDLTDRANIEALVDRTLEEFGRLDHLVTSAGGPPRMQPLEPDDEDWYYAFDMLVMGVVRAVRTAVPHLHEDDGGTIVSITSRVTKEATPSNVLSSSVRMAVIGYEKTLSKELAPDIRANAVLPGAHETPRLTTGWEQAVKRGDYESMAAARAARSTDIPMDRPGDPMELGDMVAYLSSPKAGFVNGQAIVIDGGSGSATY